LKVKILAENELSKKQNEKTEHADCSRKKKKREKRNNALSEEKLMKFKKLFRSRTELFGSTIF